LRHSHSANDGGSLVEYTEAFNPIDELNKASKVSRMGKLIAHLKFC
jgi:hypothetical protein